MSNYYVGEAVYKTIRIDEHEYQVPEAVASHLEKLADALAEEKAQRAKEYDKLQKVASKDFNIVADRIMLNLNEGLPPMGASRWSRAKFERDNRCLAFSIDETFGKVDAYGNPKFDFGDEVKRRILAALMGQTSSGEEHE